MRLNETFFLVRVSEKELGPRSGVLDYVVHGNPREND